MAPFFTFWDSEETPIRPGARLGEATVRQVQLGDVEVRQLELGAVTVRQVTLVVEDDDA